MNACMKFDGESIGGTTDYDFDCWTCGRPYAEHTATAVRSTYTPFYEHVFGPGGRIEKQSSLQSAMAARFDYSAAELATAQAIGAEATRKCMEKVREMSAWRDRTLEAALAAILAAGVPREWLVLEYVCGSDEVCVKQRLHPSVPVVIGEVTPGVVLARIWTSFDLDACTITQHYEGPALAPVCVEHSDISGATRRLYPDLEAAIAEVARATHEPLADVRLGLVGGAFTLGTDIWKIVTVRPEDT